MESPIEQLDRIKRSFDKIKDNKNRVLEDYKDDLYHFFQDCWHLKDWIRNYPTLDKNKKDIENKVENSTYIKICSDIANRTKHFQLNGTGTGRVNGKIEKINTNITLGTHTSKGHGELIAKVKTESTCIDAIELAEKAIEEWEGILKTYDFKST